MIGGDIFDTGIITQHPLRDPHQTDNGTIEWFSVPVSRGKAFGVIAHMCLAHPQQLFERRQDIFANLENAEIGTTTYSKQILPLSFDDIPPTGTTLEEHRAIRELTARMAICLATLANRHDRVQSTSVACQRARFRGDEYTVSPLDDMFYVKATLR